MEQAICPLYPYKNYISIKLYFNTKLHKAGGKDRGTNTNTVLFLLKYFKKNSSNVMSLFNDVFFSQGGGGGGGRDGGAVATLRPFLFPLDFNVWVLLTSTSKRSSIDELFSILL